MPEEETSGWSLGRLIGPVSFLVLMLVMLLVLQVFGRELKDFRQYTGENVGLAQQSSAGGVDCSGVATVPAEYLDDIRTAANEWLGGDQAALIALIQIESGWNRTATNGQSSAAGLGQFITSTAKGMAEFGGTTIYDRPDPQTTPDDGRYDAHRSIRAAAHYLGRAMERYGAPDQAYKYGYHTIGNQGQYETAAERARQRFVQIYQALLDTGCRQTASLLGTSSDIGGRIVATAEKYIGQTTNSSPGSSENVFRCNAPTRSCASFVSWVLKEAGATDGLYKSTTQLWHEAGGTLVINRGGPLDVQKLEPGDVVWFGDGTQSGNQGALFNHVGIYVGNGLIIDTSSESRRVVKRSIGIHRGSNSFSAAKRFGL